MRLTREEYAVPRMRTLPKTLKADKQVLLSFACDPYCRRDAQTWHTRAALKLLLESNTPVAVLTKGGNRLLRDLDLFRKFGDRPASCPPSTEGGRRAASVPSHGTSPILGGRIMVGQTLTSFDSGWITKNEPEAAPYQERMEVFKTLKMNRIHTWASMEPVIDPYITVNIIYDCLYAGLVDVFKIGKLNHEGKTAPLDYRGMLRDIVDTFRDAEHTGYYIKKDLQPYAEGLDIDPIHFDPDAWMVTSAPLGNRLEGI